MLDLHANLTTPGAVLVLGAQGTIAPGGDGQSVPGVPTKSDKGAATLVGWGFLSPTADSIARMKLSSQDQVDPVNGVDIAPGATNIKVAEWMWERLRYESGQRVIQVGTNVGVVAGSALLLDYYSSGGPCVKGGKSMEGLVSPATATTFGAALVANTWGAQPFNPATPLPAGKYAILGARVSAITNVAALRFSHADWAFMPGFPVVNEQLTAALGLQLAPKDELFMEGSYAFVKLGDMLGVPCCPVFTVGPGSTGLTIWAIAAQACTPVVTLILAKVG